MDSRTSAPPSPRAHSRLLPIFVRQNRLRSGWRLLVFLALFFASAILSAKVLVYFVPRIHAWAISQPTETRNPGFSIFEQSWLIVFLFLATFVMSKIEKRPFQDYGLPRRGMFGKKFLLGLIVGLGAVSLLMALIAAFGGYSPGSLALGFGSALRYAFVWAIVFVLVGVSEEFLFRGYAQVTLASGIGFWPAAMILSIAFASTHFDVPGEKWPGLLMLFCFGMLAAFTLRRTGDLWFIIGVHAAWDWAHMFLFSVPIAGVMGPGQLLHSSIHGPRWLTGGSVGPDGSVFAFVVLLLIAGLVSRGSLPSRANPA
jgi:uncharacterized protein